MEFLCRWYLELWMPSYRASWRIWGSPFPLLATDHAMAIHSHSHPWQIPHDTPGWPRRILHGATLTISWQRHLARSQFPSIGMPMHAVYAVYAVYAISISIYIYIYIYTYRIPHNGHLVHMVPWHGLRWSDMVWHGLISLRILKIGMSGELPPIPASALRRLRWPGIRGFSSVHLNQGLAISVVTSVTTDIYWHLLTISASQCSQDEVQYGSVMFSLPMFSKSWHLLLFSCCLH